MVREIYWVQLLCLSIADNKDGTAISFAKKELKKKVKKT
jgi:hypothetical protein